MKRARSKVSSRYPTTGERGASDLLNYQAMVGDGVVALKDEHGGMGGPLLAGFWYEGPDFDSARADELEHLSVTVNRAMRRLGTGWMVHVQSLRRVAHGYLASTFEEPIDRLIDSERRERSAHFVTTHGLFVTQAHTPLAQNLTLRRVGKWLLGETLDEAVHALEARVERFEHELTALESTLGLGLTLRRMRHHGDNDELLQALQFVVSGRWKRCRLPANPVYLDVLLAHDLVVTAEELVYGDSHIGVVGVQDLPESSRPGMLLALEQLGIEFRWSSRFILMDYRAGRTSLDSLRRLWSQKRTSLGAQVMGTEGVVDRDAVARTAEVEEALGDNESGHVRFGHYTMNVVVRCATQAQAQAEARLVAKTLEDLGYESRVEDLNRIEALLGTFPGHGVQNVRKPVINTLNFADQMPLSTEWQGSSTSPCPFFGSAPALLQARSWRGAPYYLNLHVGDVGHTLVIGPTGAGKSTLLGTLCQQYLRYANAQVFVCDKGESMLPLTLAHRDAAHFALGGDDSPELCPLACIDADSDRAWAAEWLEELLVEQGVVVSPGQRAALYQAVGELAESSEGASERTLTHLYAHIQEPSLREALAYYTTGVGGLVLNGSSNRLAYARFTTFELGHLLAAGRDRVASPTLLYLFREIEKRLDGRPTLLVIDEAWLQLSHPRFSAKLREWLKTLRKANCAVVMATQSLGDVTHSSIADAVFESCPTRILLPNAQAASDSLRALYTERLQLNEAQLAAVRHAQPKAAYVVVQGTSSRLFTLDLGPVAMSFVGATGKQDVARVHALHEEYGELWPCMWLEQRGLHGAAARLRIELSNEGRQPWVAA